MGFREIAEAIRQDVVAGRWKPGEYLPTEPALAEMYEPGASRSLVNRAVQLLSYEGVVRPQQGRGTQVTWLPPMLHSPARYSRRAREGGAAKGAFDAEVKALGLEPTHEIVVEQAIPPDHIAELLNIPAGVPSALVRRRRLLASGIPVRLNASWFALDIAAGTVLEAQGPVIVGGVKTALAEIGYPQVSAKERYINRRPTPEEAKALGISPERDVIEIIHIGKTADGQVVEVTTTTAAANRLVIETDDFPLN